MSNLLDLRNNLSDWLHQTDRCSRSASKEVSGILVKKAQLKSQNVCENLKIHLANSHATANNIEEKWTLGSHKLKLCLHAEVEQVIRGDALGKLLPKSLGKIVGLGQCPGEATASGD